MDFISENIWKVRRKILKLMNGIPHYPIKSDVIGRTPIGRVLFSYLEEPLLYPTSSLYFEGSSNRWECKEIVSIFNLLGYAVDAVNWQDQNFVPSMDYDICFDICYNLARWEPYLPKSCIKLLHCTGADPFFQNEAETSQIAKLQMRHPGEYLPKRIIKNPEIPRRALELADYASLIGNQWTLSTFPNQYHKKITLIPDTGSFLGENIKKKGEYLSSQRQFLWFNGSGVIHKGLDITLEVFARHPEWELNIIGGGLNELDFVALYESELRKKNIHHYGYLNPCGKSIRTILNRCFCFISPSVSEGISSSVVTCLQMGLFPIISQQCGVTLPDSCGIYLSDCTENSVEKAILQVFKLTDFEMNMQIQRVQEIAFTNYHRESFSTAMKNYLSKAICIRYNPL